MKLVSQLNHQYIAQSLKTADGTKRLVGELRNLIRTELKDRLGDSQLQGKVLSDDNIAKILNWALDRIQFLHDLLSKDFLFLWIIPENLDLASTSYSEDEADRIIKSLLEAIEKVPDDDYHQDKLNDFFKDFAKKSKLKFPAAMKFFRLILCDMKEGPSIAEIFLILGKQDVCERLRFARQMVAKKPSANRQTSS